jgi:hypothetical protein
MVEDQPHPRNAGKLISQNLVLKSSLKYSFATSQNPTLLGKCFLKTENHVRENVL